MTDVQAEPGNWLVENASDIVSVIGQDGIIRFESPSVERLLGWRPEELVGRRLLNYVHPDDAPRVVEAIGRRLADPTPVNLPTELRVRARDGSWRVLAAMSRVVTDATGASALIVNSRDVTEQRALEERLRQAQRTEVIAQLAAAAAHEINNPLTILLAHLAILQRNDPQNPRIAKMVDAAERIRDIVHGMSRISRPATVRSASPSLPEMLDIRTSSGGAEAPPADRGP